MKIKFTILFFLLSTSIFAQTVNLPIFGKVNLPQPVNGEYSIGLGSWGKFSFTGTVNPLSLSTSVGMDDLKMIPGAKIMQAFGLQDIEMTITSNDFEVAGNIDDKLWSGLADKVESIP
jgi:tellurite resistance-related uncharacterized protein